MKRGVKVLVDDIKMLLARKNVSKSELARLMNDSPQNLGLKFKRNTFKDNDLRKIFDALGVNATIVYEEKDNGDILFTSKI